MAGLTVAHVGNFSPLSANGVATAGWWLASAEARLGAKVFVYRIGELRIDDLLQSGILQRTFPSTIKRMEISAPLREWIMENQDGIQVLHMHSVFTPINSFLAHSCRKARIPYLLTPHGGYNPNIFQRGRLKKKLYFGLFERHLLRNASGVHCVAAPERKDIHRLGYRGPIVVASNLFDMSGLLSLERNPHRRIIWLGRWDIHHKGLDRLVNIWRNLEKSLPEFELHLYGEGHGREQVTALVALSGARRLFIHPPVYGSEKTKILSEADLYIHLSRWEVFGIAITEAMAAGIPVALSSGCYIAEEAAHHKACLIIPENDSDAAGVLAELLTNKNRCDELGVNGRSFVQKFCNEEAVATSLIDFCRAIASSP